MEDIEFYMDFHDVIVDAEDAWVDSLQMLLERPLFDKAVIDYKKKMSRHDIATKYSLSYHSWEMMYRDLLQPIYDNVELAKSIAAYYKISILSLAPHNRIDADIIQCNIPALFFHIIAKEDLKGQSKIDYLRNRSHCCKWCVYITHETTIYSVEDNIIIIPCNRQSEILDLDKSFDDHARHKKLYHELSKYYLLSISNDTNKEKDFIDAIIKLHNFASNIDILDCCCGVGRHAYTLWEMGYHVTGIDFSEEQISNARIINKQTDNKFFVMDVRNITLPAYHYPVAICMWTTYNYLSKEMELLSFISGVARYQKANDLLILDSKNIPALADKRYYMRTKTDLDRHITVTLMVWKKIINSKFQCSDYFYFIDDNGAKDAFHDDEYVRFYSLPELEDIVKPWYTIDSIYGDFDLSPYSESKSTRFIAVLKRYWKDQDA